MLRVRLLLRNGQSIARSLSTKTPTNTQLLRPVWSRYEKQTSPHVLDLYKKTWKETGDPIWPFILGLKTPRSNQLTNSMLRDTGVKLALYIRWRKFIDSAGLVEVASRINGTSSISEFPSIAKMPTWALGYVLTFRVTNPPEARAAAELVIAHVLSGCSQTTIPPLLILSAHGLADHQVIAPLKTIAELFLARHRLPSQYGLFLQALSRFPPSLECNTVISTIIEQIHKDGGEISEDIYVSLLQSNSSSVPLAQRLERLLPVTNTRTTPRLNDVFFQVYTRQGATTLAVKYLPSIFERAGLHGTGGPILSPSRSPAPTDDSPAKFQSKVDGDPLISSPPRPDSISKDIPASISASVKSWTSLFRFFSKSRSVSADKLVELFNRIRKIHPPTTTSFTILMRALVARKAYQRAIETWHEMLTEGHPIDVGSLSVIIDACTLTKKHWEAFYVLEVTARKGSYGNTTQPNSDDSYPRVQLDSTFLAAFMKSLALSGRPDVAFMVWDHAELLYGVTPDASALNVLLEISRAVLKYEETFTGFWAHLRAKRSSTRPDNLFSPFHVPSRDEVIESIRLTFNRDPRKKHKPTGLWGDVPAWQKATKIFYHAVLGNHANLLHISPPVTAMRSSADDMYRHPWVEFIRSVQGPSPANEVFHDVDVNSPASLARLGLYPLQAYQKINPTKATFHNLIYLLGMCGQASQIPMVLTWMKELEIVPFERTTAMALIFWAEVSLRAPLFEQFGGEGEYSKLLNWLEAWIGKDRIPGQARMTKMSRMIARAREGYDKFRV